MSKRLASNQILCDCNTGCVANSQFAPKGHGGTEPPKQTGAVSNTPNSTGADVAQHEELA
jgi:hypothetical protein